MGTDLATVVLDRAARPLVGAKVRPGNTNLPGHKLDDVIRQVRAAARKPAMPAVVLQQEREPERGGASPAPQQDTVLIEQGPELDQLADVIRQLLHNRQSSPSHWGW